MLGPQAKNLGSLARRGDAAEILQLAVHCVHLQDDTVTLSRRRV
jgi:hypothetical protein